MTNAVTAVNLRPTVRSGSVMRTALVLSVVIHAFGALGISRLGGLVFGQSDAMAMAVSVELVEQQPEKQPQAVPASPGTAHEPTAQPLPRRPAASSRAVRARRPPTEAPPSPNEGATSATQLRDEAAAERPGEGPTIAAPGPTTPDHSPSHSEAHDKALGAAPAGPAPSQQPRATPSWATINQVVRQHVVYPALARRRGFQGQATVAFRVIPGGRVDQLQVVESSGHSLLDAAALEAVSRSVPLPISAEATRIVLPIVFSLQ